MFSKDTNVFPLRTKVVAILLIFSTFFNLSLANLPYVPCRTPEVGARAKFYEYPLKDTASFNNPDFLLGGYTKNKYLGEVSSVKNISWDSGWPAVVYPYGFKSVPITNFLMAVTAYYRAPQTGVFSISLKADDFAAVYVGNNPIGDSCILYKYNFTANELVVSNNRLETATKNIYMEKGVYYPIQVIYVNYMERGILSVNMIKPDGTVDAGLTENLYVMPESSYMIFPPVSRTRYVTSTESFLPSLTVPTTISTITSIYLINNNMENIDIIYVVDEPLSTTTPTTTTDVSVPFTSSYTTPVTGSTGFSTTTGGSVPITSSYTTPITGSIGSLTTTGVSVPITSTYTTVITGTIASASPEVVFTIGVEVEVRY